MPGSVYPPASGTLTGELRTISRYLANPKLVTRDLRTLTNKKFIGDRILKGRVEAEGGMVEYEVGESIYAGGTPEDVEPMAEFPLVGVGDATAVLERVGKFGFRTRITLESVKRRRQEPVTRARRKLANSIVLAFDGRVMAKINAAKPSMNTLVGSSWSSGTPTILRQLLTAKAMIDDELEGYIADAVLLDNTKWAILASDKDLQQAMKRETVDTPVYSGELLRIAGLEIIPAPTGTVGATDPIVYDSTQLGSIVQETFGEQRDDQGVEAETAYHGAASETDGAEYWTIAAKRRALPIIQEPQAAVVITGT